jgi:hypothetical protein
MMRRSRILCASGYRCVLLHSMTWIKNSQSTGKTA